VGLYRLAIEGEAQIALDYQIDCGIFPASGYLPRIRLIRTIPTQETL